MMILHFFILCLPFALELAIEVIAEKRYPQWVEKHDKAFHFWSAVARGVLMIVIAVIFHLLEITKWWQAFVFMVSLHFAFFNYLYNALTNRKLTYLRSKGIDGLLRNVPWWGVALWQLIILITGLMVYYQIWGFKL